MLWWLTGRRSFDLDCSFDTVPVEARPLVFAKELSDSTEFLPGPASVKGLLSHAGLKDRKKVALSHVINAATEPTTFVVRVQVIVDGLRGQCARNREVDVRPPPSGVQPSGVQTAFVRPVDHTFGAWVFSDDHSFGLTFTVLRTMTLRSVRVYPEGTGTLVVRISDADGKRIGSSSAVIRDSGDQRVSVGMTLPPGDYEISLTGTSLSPPGMPVTTSAVVFPYTVPEVVRITSAVTTDVSNVHNLDTGDGSYSGMNVRSHATS